MRQQIYEDALKAVIAEHDKIDIDSTLAAVKAEPDVMKQFDIMAKSYVQFSTTLDHVRAIAEAALDRKSDPAGMSTVNHK